MRVALIGLDGSGKSANIDKMKLDSDYSDYSFVWVRWKPTLLKPIYLLMEKKISKKKKNIDSNTDMDDKKNEKQAELNTEYNIKSGLKERIFGNVIVRNTWMLLALVDYLFQFYIKVLPLIISGKNIIFDRCFLDLFVDQGINFGYTPEKIRNEILRYSFMFPKIDRYVYIRVSPETCYMRKNDIPNLTYLNLRYKIYECLSNEKNWIKVDGELPFAKVNAQIRNVIMMK